MRKTILILLLILLVIPKEGYSWWNSSWEHRKLINVSENVGVNRIFEPIDVWINFESNLSNATEEVRVVRCNLENTPAEACPDSSWIEIPSQVYNETYVSGNVVSANVIFQPNISANSWRVYYIYYGNNQTNYPSYPRKVWFRFDNNWHEMFSEGQYYKREDWRHVYEDLEWAETRWNITGVNDQLSCQSDIPNGGKWYPIIPHIETNYQNIYSGPISASRKFYQNNTNLGINHTFSIFANYPVIVDKNTIYDVDGVDDNITSYQGPHLFAENKFGWGTYEGDPDVYEFTKQGKEPKEYKENMNWTAIYYNASGEFRGLIFLSWYREDKTISDAYVADYYDWPCAGASGPRIAAELGLKTIPANGNVTYYHFVIFFHTPDNHSAVIQEAEEWEKKIKNPLRFSVGREETLPTLSLSVTVDKNIYIDQNIPITAEVKYDDTPITSLVKPDFQLFLDDDELSINDFKNNNDGTYSFSTHVSSKNLGKHNLKLKAEYDDKSAQAETTINLLVRPKEKLLIITNDDWKNYIPAVTTRKPTLVYESNREFIDYFILDYKPDQTFQLGTNLSFSGENYFLDSPETLMRLFFKNTDIITPINEEIAIASSMLGLPILFDPSEEIIEFLNPSTIYNFSSVDEIENVFIQNNPSPDYFILTNPNDEDSMFAADLAIAKNGFIILSDASPTENKNMIIQKINEFKLPRSYFFDQTIHLAIIGNVPSFSVQDPVDEKLIKTDTPYADINDDGFLDLSLGRLTGSPESVSFQIEYSRILKPDKTALILAAYNTPGRYLDVLTAGGTMPYVIDTEMELIDKGFKTTRLVEKRSEYDELNSSILEELNRIAEELGILFASSYVSFFSSLLSDLNKLFLIAKAGDTIMYSIYEFDWLDSWQSILNIEPRYPKHLPLLNEQNVMDHVPENRVIAYFSKGNETHWFLPENTSTFWSTYTVFDLSRLSFNPAFYYLRYTKSFPLQKLLERGALALIGYTAESYYIHSSRTAYEFFKNFDEPIGKSLLETKNRNLEFDSYQTTSPRIYKKEYYTTNLAGEPSLVLDPSLELEQSGDIRVEDGISTITFSIKPEYSLVDSFLIFEDVDDYLLIDNKPMIPLYKRSFILPTDAKILDISVTTPSQKTYHNITLPILIPDPEFFENETFTGSFPERFYWNGTIKLLDGRRVFDLLFSPVIYSSDNSSIVFDDIEVSFEYRTELEITKIQANDVTRGETARISFDVYNGHDKRIRVDATMRIQAEGLQAMMEKGFSLDPGLNSLSMDWTNTSEIGNYSVSLVLTHDKTTVGPKHTYFTVKKKTITPGFVYPMIRKLFSGITGFFKEITFKERYTVKKQGDTIILDYVSWNVSLHIEQTNQSTKSILRTKDGKLLIEQSPGLLAYTVNSPDGMLTVIREKGRFKESGKGDIQKLRILLKEMVGVYKENLIKLELIDE